MHKRGHEDITRYGVEIFESLCPQDIPHRDYYPKVLKGVAGTDSSNPLIRGNFQTDFPQNDYFEFYNVSYKGQTNAWLLWHNDGSLQNIHALANFDDSGLESHQNTCQGLQYRIREAVRKALHLHRLDRRDEALFWIGHATHMVQDSFSKAHTIRTGDDLRQITQFCTYGKSFDGVCSHGDGTHDRIWKDTTPCQWDPNNRNWACLKDEARQAAYATAGLYISFTQMLMADDGEFEDIMENYFNDTTREGSGFFRCH